MKNLFAIVVFISIYAFTSHANAQTLTNTRWIGNANLPMSLKCLFEFKIDTLLLKYIGNDNADLRDEKGNDVTVTGKDSLVIERMHYTLSKDTLTVQKIIGGSPCDVEAVGKYKISVNEKKLSVTLISDDCEPRVEVWPYDSLTLVE